MEIVGSTYCGKNGCRHVEDDAHDCVEVQHDEHNRQKVGEETACTSDQPHATTEKRCTNVRDEEVHQTILEQEAHELRPAALDAEDTLVSRQEQDDKVEAHGVDKRGGKDLVVGTRDSAPLTRNPDSGEKNALEDKGPVTEDDDDDGDNDALVMRPEGHPG